MPLDLERAAQSRMTPDEAALTGEGAPEPAASVPPRRWPLRAAWVFAAMVLAVIIAFKLAEFNGHPLLEPSDVQSTLTWLGLREPEAAEPFRDLEQIQLVSRELRGHPTQPGMLQLNATIVNLATRSQPYPVLEVTLLDAAGLPLAQQRFDPSDYLAEGADKAADMTPQAYLPLTLDLADPGAPAVGFELQFH
jgi:hypothetical protein